MILPGLGAIAARGRSALAVVAGAARGTSAGADLGIGRATTDPIYRYLERMERRKIGARNGAAVVCRGDARARASAFAGLGEDEGRRLDRGARSRDRFLKLLWPAVAEAFANFRGARVHEPPASCREPSAAFRRLESPRASAGCSMGAPRIEKSEAAARHLRMGERSAAARRHRAARIPATNRARGSGCLGRRRRFARAAVSTEPCWRISASPPTSLPEAVKRVETGLLRTLRDPRGRWILATHSEAECELPIAGLIDGKLIRSGDRPHVRR